MLKFSQISHSGLEALRYHQDITKISPIYPPNYIPQISPRNISYIPLIYPRIKKRYSKNISPKYPHRYDDEIEFWSLLRGGGGYPERDVGKKKKEQKDCFGGILSIGFSQCICILCSFKWFSFRNSLAHSLHVKFDFQSLKPAIVRLQLVILFTIFSTFNTIKSVTATLSPSFLYLPIYHISMLWSILQKQDYSSLQYGWFYVERPLN